MAIHLANGKTTYSGQTVWTCGHTTEPVDPDPLITLEEASRNRIDGRRHDRSTYFRWARTGLSVNGRRIHLRAERDGRTWCTRASWIREFRRAMAEAGVPALAAPVQRAAVNQADADAADALAAAGI